MPARPMGDKVVGYFGLLNDCAEDDMLTGQSQYQRLRKMQRLVSHVEDTALRVQLDSLIEDVAEETDVLVANNRDAWQFGIYARANKFDLADDIAMKITVKRRQRQQAADAAKKAQVKK